MRHYSKAGLFLTQYIAEASSYKYACVMVRLPPQCCQILHQWRESAISPDIIDRKEDTYDPLHNPFHVTVFYGLQNFHLFDMMRICQEVPPITLQVEGKLQVFDGPQNASTVIYLPVTSPDLHRLYSVIHQGIGVDPPTYKKYIPHVTLAYLKKGTPVPSTPLPFRTFPMVRYFCHYADTDGVTQMMTFSPPTITKDNKGL